MSQLFESSSPVIRSEVDLFHVLPTDASIEKSSYIEYNPTTNLQENSNQIEFVIPESTNFYRDFQKSFLYVVCQVVKDDNSNLASEKLPSLEYLFDDVTKKVSTKPYMEPVDLVAPVNNLGHSLFSQYDCFINDVMVSQTNNLYAYRAIIEAMLNYGSEYKNCQGGLSLFCEEENPDWYQTEKPDGFKTLYESISQSKMLELIMKPSVDIFHLPKYLINASLFVLNHQLYPSLRIAHEKILTSNNTAKYSFRRVEMKSFLIPTGSKSVSRENLF
ncbi:hypothetical protein Fcan01_27758 [Folsomia candida]|uniref:Uncharacterized protein n=1 Tax=Folsomia candida TaxID=158441 RepID=A0A226CYB1_FOLCA|nr:hypothetical protein Fcan01_27758 [Folsomia candida]